MLIPLDLTVTINENSVLCPACRTFYIIQAVSRKPFEIQIYIRSYLSVVKYPLIIPIVQLVSLPGTDIVSVSPLYI